MTEPFREMPNVVSPDGAARHELVILAASAGGIEAISKILRALPASFPTPIAVLQHRSATAPSVLEKILGRQCKLRVKNAEPSEPFVPGTVYVAPAAEHLIVGADRRFHHRDGTRVHHLRSAADPLIRSAAHALGGNVIAVILTGSGRNGSESVRDVKALGGTVIAQDPATARHGAMPRAAIATGAVDYVLPLEEIGPMLVRLTSAAPNEGASSKEAV
jgi:two-component system, chemotaxis family, protein-glutamate methylesterase/glutaminase